MYTTPPGWYPDPTKLNQLRFWNGTAWTEHVASDPNARTAVAATPNQTPNTPVSKTRTVAILAIGLLTVVLTIAAGVFYTNHNQQPYKTFSQRQAERTQCQQDAFAANLYMQRFNASHGFWIDEFKLIPATLVGNGDTSESNKALFNRLVSYRGARIDVDQHKYLNDECGDGS